jgi:HEAT repeat protein
MPRLMVGFLVCLSSLSLLAGCGEVPVAASKRPAKKRTKVTPASQPAIVVPKVEQSAFASVDAAMAEVEALAKSDSEDDSQKLRRIETWLNMQGAAIAPDLATKINDPAAGLATRLTACRVLARQGAVATAPLLTAIDKGEPAQLRLKAIESLGRVKPASAEAVQKLVSLIDHEDYDVSKVALSALTRIGPPVKQHEPKIVELLIARLNDTNEDETVRSLAKEALKKIDPRRGLQNAH